MSRFIGFVAALAISACTPGCILVSKDGVSWVGPKQEAKTADEVASLAAVEYDQYKRSTWVTGPKLWRENGETAGGMTLFMRSLWIDGKSDGCQLYVSDSGFGWRFYGRANDIDGNALPLTEISREPVGQYCFEDVAVELPHTYLEERRASGLSIKVWGNAGERVVDLPAFYVDGFLRKIDEYRASTSGAVAGNSAP